MVLIGTLAVLIFGLYTTGHGYLVKGIYHTYLHGKTGPGIYDLDVFPSAKLSPGEAAELLPSTQTLSSEDIALLAEGKTTAFLVFENGQPVIEHYFEDHGPETVSNSFSMAKSIVALLVYQEMEKDSTFTAHSVAADFLPFTNPGFDTIRIEELLTMSATTQWIESGKNPFSHNAKAYYGNDLKELILDMKTEAGKPEFHYKSGNSQILSLILEAKTQQPVYELAQNQLWSKIGARNEAYWSTDEVGNVKAFCCYYATARDFSRFGELILREGNMNGEQIIDTASIHQMLSAGEYHDQIPACYAHHWWRELHKGEQLYYMRGILGQYVVVLPEQDRVIVRLGHQRKERNERNHPLDLYDYLEISSHY